MPKTIQELTDLLAELPGLGPRQARRIVQYLLYANGGYRKKLTGAIEALTAHVSQCERCFRFDEVNTSRLCALCADKNRDTSLLMVIEKDVDLEGIESSGVYRGTYFILGSLIPLGRQRKSAAPIRSSELLSLLGKDSKLIKEVILAFSTTPEGDYTAHELKTKITKTLPHIKTTILGRGLSLGAEIEYADEETLRSALQGRREEF